MLVYTLTCIFIHSLKHECHLLYISSSLYSRLFYLLQFSVRYPCFIVIFHLTNIFLHSFLHMFLLPPNNSDTYNSSNIYIRTFLWKCILYVFLYKTKNSTRNRSNTFTIPLLCASPFNFLSNFSLRPITILGIRRIPQPRNSCHRLLALYLLFDRSVKRIFYKRPCSLSDVTIAHFQAGTRCDIVQYITLINNL